MSETTKEKREFEALMPLRARRRRGSALLDPDQRRESPGQGGGASHDAGTRHEFTKDEARAAARRRLQLRSGR